MQADVKIFRIFPVLDPYVEAPVGVFSRRQRRVEPQVEPQVEVVASPARRRVALGDEMSHGYVVAEHGLAVGKHGLEFEEVFGGRAAVVGGQPEAADVGLHQADVGLGGCARARPFVRLYGVGTVTVLSLGISAASFLPEAIPLMLPRAALRLPIFSVWMVTWSV